MSFNEYLGWASLAQIESMMILCLGIFSKICFEFMNTRINYIQGENDDYTLEIEIFEYSQEKLYINTM